ncbi:MAG: hypothetical protein LW699_03505 [Pirellula sp.]|nr:hypothetical protein [Pirellula sp.]
MRTGVLKIGGASVFSSPTASDPLHQFLLGIRKDNLRRWFVIVGGGDTVESMRTLHRHHPQLDSQRMHWRCVDLLRATPKNSHKQSSIRIRDATWSKYPPITTQRH